MKRKQLKLWLLERQCGNDMVWELDLNLLVVARSKTDALRYAPGKEQDGCGYWRDDKFSAKYVGVASSRLKRGDIVIREYMTA